MRPIFLALSIFAFAGASTVATAECNLRVEKAYIPEPPPGSRVAAAYFTVTNDCDSKAVLVDAEAGAGAGAKSGVSASLHRSSTQGGVSRMDSVARIEIGESESVVFAPGGLHVMLHAAKLEAGHRFPFRLVFEDGRRIAILADIVAVVRAPVDAVGPEHQKHHSGGGE